MEQNYIGSVIYGAVGLALLGAANLVHYSAFGVGVSLLALLAAWMSCYAGAISVVLRLRHGNNYGLPPRVAFLEGVAVAALFGALIFAFMALATLVML